VPPGDDEAERRLRQLGVLHVLPSDSSPEDLSAAVLQAVSGTTAPSPGERVGLADPRAALPELPAHPDPLGLPDTGIGTGRILAVWGPAGAPGRTTLAVTLAGELAGLGRPTLLADVDVYGGVVAQVLGLLDEAPGVAAACRLANSGALDLAGLADLVRSVTPTLRVLSGIARADRWPELRPAALEVVLELCRSLAAMTVVDCGFSLEQDEELAYDTAAPRRNGATLTVLEAADTVCVVGAADPVGLQRLVRGLAELKGALPGVQPLVVVNKLRGSAIPGPAEQEVRAALARYAGVAEVVFVPFDVEGVDRALVAGRTLAEAAPASPARTAVTALAASLAGVAGPAPAKRRILSRR
jgi:MinD-like ATPase involved in chromosome partitioning or flagellar assembly